MLAALIQQLVKSSVSDIRKRRVQHRHRLVGGQPRGAQKQRHRFIIDRFVSMTTENVRGCEHGLNVTKFCPESLNPMCLVFLTVHDTLYCDTVAEVASSRAGKNPVNWRLSSPWV